MLRACLCLFLLSAAPLRAANLCGLTDESEVLAAIAGVWRSEARLSLENATTSLLRVPPPERVIVRSGLLDTPFLDDLTGAPVPLGLASPPPYDVDTVDDLLDATENAEIADILSDTRCGPEDLPQLVAGVSQGAGTEAEGTVTLVAYFDDRMLQITEMTLRTEGAILFLTGTALLTRSD